MDYFSSARIKLTAWYLLIIMLVSIFFSVAFYGLATREIKRVIFFEENRPKTPAEFQLPAPRNFTFRTVSLKNLEQAANRLKITLIIINGVIFVVAGGAAYFLAGRTLKPIKQMVDEQNRFVSDASHEMRTPLTSLRSEIEVALRDKKLSISDAGKILESNLEEVISLQTLSNNLLELSQKGAPQYAPKAQIFIKDAIEQALKKLNGSIKKKGIQIKTNADGVSVVGVSERVVELFVILLDNAVKYSPSKSTINIVAKSKDNQTTIEIKDQGMGIPKEDLPHVFDRFYRSDKSRGKTSGHGLGLSIAKEIVESMNGTITLKSPAQKGTLVSIEF